MTIFFKYQATGNDFIIIDDRLNRFSGNVQRLCHRQLGIGADGLILLQESISADFRMRIYNSDGKETESCGNGLRCLIRFLHDDLAIHQKTYSIETQAQIVTASLNASQVVVDLGPPKNFRFDSIHQVDTGVPHAVQFVSEIDKIDIQILGAHLRNRLNANVDFAQLNPNGIISVRTYERGVEAETLSCGTGAAAVACIAQRLYQWKNPTLLHFLGGPLEVFTNDKDHLLLKGPAQKTFQVQAKDLILDGV